MPRFVLPVTLGLLLAGGLFLSGPVAWLGAVLLLGVAAFLGWLLALSWPVVPVGARLGRSLVVIGVLGLAYLKVTGNL